MGRNNQQRRAAKKRLRERQVRGSASAGSGSGQSVGGPGRNAGPPGGFGPPGSGWPFHHGPWDNHLLDDADLSGDDLDDADVDDDLSGGTGQRNAWRGGGGPGGAGGSTVDVAGLILTGARAVTAGADGVLEQVVAALIRADQRADQPADGGAAGRGATERLLALVGDSYERGWQPADLMHVARRGLATHGIRLAAAVIGHQFAVNPMAGCAPDRWLTQLADVAGEIGSTNPEKPDRDRADGLTLPPITEWLRADGQNAWDAWRDILALVALLHGLSPLQMLAEPPSRWSARRTRGQSAAGGAAAGSVRPVGGGIGDSGADSERRAKMLGRIRALLAKAEATAFPEEAEAFSAKAQELMSRYSIDEAVLHAHDGHAGKPDVRARRFHIDSPYASTKVQLLAAVGRANRARVIWLDNVGMATAVGDPFDLDLVDMLFTSLLVQATRAVTEAGRLGQTARSASFRRAFLLAYAQRIGERLEQTDAQAVAASGAELVLASRAEAVDEEFGRLFPNTTTMRTRRVNAHGWHAGRAAADRAVIAHGQLASDA